MIEIILIEDRQGLREMYAKFLRQQEWAVHAVESAEAALTALKTSSFDVVLTDYMLPGLNGLELLRKIKQQDANHVVIVMTAFGEVNLAVEAMKAGAFDFLEKPVDLEHLKLVIRRAAENVTLKRKLQHRQAREPDTEIIGQSPALLQAIEMVDRVAGNDACCLLLGESGVGKELFAQRIHASSGREGEMVSLNCASLPAELIESELFGHERGAFTGADSKKHGLVEMASGGTLFLDEIGELPLNLQPKLLRFLQEQTYRRVGGTRELKANARIVAATNKELKRGVREGWFREDLYFRLAVFPVEIPPLRERGDDVISIAEALLARKRYQHLPLNNTLQKALRAYTWPGNVRELVNVLERALILAGERPLEVRDFPMEMKQPEAQFQVRAQVDLSEGLKTALKQLEVEAEGQLLRQVAQSCGNHRGKMAEMLGIAPKTLSNKLKDHQIEL